MGKLLQNDMHSHILPGIDDGSPDVATSVELIKGMIKTGYTKLTGTPHIMYELHKNNRHSIEKSYQSLMEGVKKEGLDIQVHYAAEYMLDEGFMNHLNEGNMLTIDKNIILIETPFYQEPMDIKDILFKIETAGYQAILAHPERYHFMDNKLKAAEKYLDHNCFLQLNILSLTGYYGPKEKQTAERLLDAGLVSFLGTDLHHQRHLRKLQGLELSNKIIKKIEAISWKNTNLYS